jgi:hypothetical protein
MVRTRNAVWLLAIAAVTARAIDFSRVSADSLRANITWLAADERAGRMTPSPGLDASADYVAEQFRLAGLSPAGPDGTFFQPAPFSQVKPRLDGFRIVLEAGSRRSALTADSVTVRSLTALDYQDAPVLRLPRSGPVPDVAGRVVAGNGRYDSEAPLNLLEAKKPSLILLIVGGERPKEALPRLMENDPSVPPVIRIYNRTTAELLNGKAEVRLTLHVAAPDSHDVTLRNVAGILRGADPAVRDQFVILSAHYDHLGVSRGKVYPGANDDASGTASLIEVAKALNAEPRTRRSVLFLALFGEEEGLLGSAFYVRHPLIPIARTVADINLEQLGRTDSYDGPEIARFAISGPSYSNLPTIMAAAAKTEGTTLYPKENADDYFDRSDNYSFAEAGIVAHTVVVAFEFPDYHAPTDEAGKIDYENLVKVDRGIGAGVAAVANAADVPRWSENPAARVFRNLVH